jgi:hypothetical protein
LAPYDPLAATDLQSTRDPRRKAQCGLERLTLSNALEAINSREAGPIPALALREPGARKAQPLRLSGPKAHDPGRPSGPTNTNDRWFLSVCHRMAGTGASLVVPGRGMVISGPW